MTPTTDPEATVSERETEALEACAREPRLRCPFCKREWATMHAPQEYEFCPHCRGSFSFNTPQVVAPRSETEPSEDVATALRVLEDYDMLEEADKLRSRTTEEADHGE